MALLPFLPIFEKDRPSSSPLTHPLDFLTMHSAATTTSNSSMQQFNHLTANSTDICHPSDTIGGSLAASRHDGPVKPDFTPLLGLNDSSFWDHDQSRFVDRTRDQVLRVYYLLTGIISRRLSPLGPQRPVAPPDTNAKLAAQNPTRRHARSPPDPAELRLLPPTNSQEPTPYRRDPQTTLMMTGFPSYLSSLARFSAAGGVSLKSPPSPSLLPPPPPLLFPPGLKGTHLMTKEDSHLARTDAYKQWRPESMSAKKLHLLESSSEPRTRKRNLKRCTSSALSGGGALTDRRRQIFRRGGRVHLADGTVQRVECLQLEDFIQSWITRTAAEIADVSLCWALVQNIEAGATARDVRISFRIQEFLMADVYGPLASEGPLREVQRLALTFEHQCSAENPFFVRTCGWSAWEPQLVHLHCGIICRQLALGDTCLVLLTGPPPALQPPRPSTPPEAALATVRVTTKPPPELSFSQDEGRRARELPPGSKFKRKESSKENSTESPSTPPKTKRSPGSVPNYFSAASLAKSPFEIA